MKTFIWCREYEVLIANAETVEQARKLLYPKLRDMLYPEITDTIRRFRQYKKLGDMSYLTQREEWWKREIRSVRNQVKKELSLLLDEPEEIINENSSIILGHANE